MRIVLRTTKASNATGTKHQFNGFVPIDSSAWISFSESTLLQWNCGLPACQIVLSHKGSDASKNCCISSTFLTLSYFFSRLLWLSAEAIGTKMLQITTPVAYHNARKIWTARSEETIMQQRVVSNVQFCKSTAFTTFFFSIDGNLQSHKKKVHLCTK